MIPKYITITLTALSITIASIASNAQGLADRKSDVWSSNKSIVHLHSQNNDMPRKPQPTFGSGDSFAERQQIGIESLSNDTPDHSHKLYENKPNIAQPEHPHWKHIHTITSVKIPDDAKTAYDAKRYIFDSQTF
ncbi:hypothetical protein [Marinobacter fonticola]|uniref:hypothetical protein n=1 Tax=Marinobacter fonticola TaxID=2603215 RepID=UPI0011E73902|nr:hypothetical protein [Marinobacter fonticola]